MKNSQDNASNIYLSKLEEWDESQVSYYERKVCAQVKLPWNKTFLLLALFGAFTGVIWLANLFLSSFGIAGGVFGIVSSELCTIALAALFTVIAVVVAICDASSKNAKFVDDNHGEVGHKGGAYVKKLKLSMVLAIAVVILACAAIFVATFMFVTEGDFGRYSLKKAMEVFFTMDIFGSLVFIPTALLYAFVYYLSSLLVLKGYATKVCPVCGRSRFRLVKSVSDKKAKANDASIDYAYGQYRFDSKIEGGANDVAVTYCKYCSYFADSKVAPVDLKDIKAPEAKTEDAPAEESAEAPAVENAEAPAVENAEAPAVENAEVPAEENAEAPAETAPIDENAGAPAESNDSEQA